MKNSVAIASLLICILCTQRSMCAAGNREIQELEFRFEPSFENATMIWLAKIRGEVTCVVYSVPEFEILRRGERKGLTKLSESKVSASAFDDLARALEEPTFVEAAETMPPSGLDGATYYFRKKIGSRQVEYTIWTPEASPALKMSVLAPRLRDQFLSLAGLKWPLPKRPNKAPEPTTTSVTPPAAQESRRP